MKHLHMLMAALTVVLFCYSAFLILSDKPAKKSLMAVSHTLYAVLVGSGLYLLYVISMVAGVQHWAYAKILLLVVAVSSMIKARRTERKNEAKVGVGIAMVALVGILWLAFSKPILA